MLFHLFKRASIGALIGTTLFAAPPLLAKQPAQQSVTLEGWSGKWTKLCGTDTNTHRPVCYTTRDFGAPGRKDGPILALAVYAYETPRTYVFRALVPVGLLTDFGVRAAFDNNAPLHARYKVCVPNGCFAEAPLTSKALQAMHHSGSAEITVQNANDVVLTFIVPLDGFDDAFDGEGARAP